MRTPGLLLGACVLALGLSMSACDAKPLQETAATTTTAQGRLVISNQSSSPLHVTATDHATSTIALDQSFGAGSTVFTSTLPAGTYTFAADLVGGTSDYTVVAVGSASGSLTAGAETQIRIMAPTTGPLQVDIGAVPEVLGVEVHEGGSSSSALVDVHVSVSSPSSGELTYFWSGAGLPGVVEGVSSISLPVASLRASAGPERATVLHVVVQDAVGVATSFDVKLDVGAGGVSGAILPSSRDRAPSVCLSTQAKCASTCTVGLAPGWLGSSRTSACLSSCGEDLASCTGG